MAPISLSKGDSLCLRKDALPHVKVREWIFMGKTEGRIILVSYKTKGGHTLEVVKEDEIDWGKYSFQNGWRNRFSKESYPSPRQQDLKAKNYVPGNSGDISLFSSVSPGAPWVPFAKITLGQPLQPG